MAEELETTGPDQTSDVDPLWQAVADRLDAFREQWSASDTPARLRVHLPASPPDLRQRILVELIKCDLELRWRQRRQPRRVADYLFEFPELASSAAFAELLFEEFRVRRQAGDGVTPDEYLAEYPEQADALAALFSLGLPELLLDSTRTDSSAANDVSLPQVGERIDDFDLIAELGSGTFASVFLARQRSMQRLVALKIGANTSAEPQTLAQLDHPHIVRVFDQRIVPERGLRLLYMEYVPGGTLQQVMDAVASAPARERHGRDLVAAIDGVLAQRGEPPPSFSPLRQMLAAMTWPEAVAWIGARLAEALDAAHSRGVIHRDIKPANVLLTADGAPKLVDFNVSYGASVEGVGPETHFGGSFGYMAPEQIAAMDPAHPTAPRDVTARADIYGLGVVLWELLLGQRPFAESYSGGLRHRARHLLSQRQAGVPTDEVAMLAAFGQGLAQVLLECLAAKPEDRPTSQAVAHALDRCRQPALQTILHPTPASFRRQCRRHFLAACLVAVLAPNLLAAAFNYAYNFVEIITDLPAAQTAFLRVQAVINSLAFTAGIGLALGLIWPVARALSDDRLLRADQIAGLTRRALTLPFFAAGISLAEWLIAGIAYPASLHVLVGTLSMETYLHFFSSLALCGLVAAVYPFLAMSALAVGVSYPALVERELVWRPDLVRLARLRRWVGVLFVLSAAVPLFAITLLVFAGSQSRLAVGVAGVVGLLGLGIAQHLVRIVHRDIDALSAA